MAIVVGEAREAQGRISKGGWELVGKSQGKVNAGPRKHIRKIQQSPSTKAGMEGTTIETGDPEGLRTGHFWKSGGRAALLG